MHVNLLEHGFSLVSDDERDEWWLRAHNRESIRYTGCGSNPWFAQFHMDLATSGEMPVSAGLTSDTAEPSAGVVEVLARCCSTTPTAPNYRACPRYIGVRCEYGGVGCGSGRGCWVEDLARMRTDAAFPIHGWHDEFRAKVVEAICQAIADSMAVVNGRGGTP